MDSLSEHILVTGGGGFIGSHLCDFYLNKNFSVIGIDNFMTGSISNIEHNLDNKNFNFIKHDIREKINIDVKLDYILTELCLMRSCFV